MDLNNLFKNINMQNLLLATSTLIGAWGGFPDSPKIFKKITENIFVQYFLVFILLYQGGTNQDITLSLIMTLVFFIVNKYIDIFFYDKELADDKK